MLRRHWLVGIFCASLGISIGCQGNFESADVNDESATSNLPGSPSLRAYRFGVWSHRLTGTGGQTVVTSGTGGTASLQGTGGQQVVGPGTGGAATGGAAATGGTVGTGGTTSPPPGTGGTASGGSTGSAGAPGGITGGTLALTVTASRTSCAAPCSVFFDATSTAGLSGTSPTPGGGTSAGDYVAANWFWNFSDTTSSHNTTIGFAVAHVFDNPGTYHVTTAVRDLAGATGSTTTTITVSAMSGKTYYVSTSGNDANNGLTTTTAFATLAHALSVGGAANNSILLRRGDTFTLAAVTNISQTGPFLIGAYADPAAPSSAKPRINVALNIQWQAAINVQGASDVRFTDLLLNYTNQNNSCTVFGLYGSTNILAERLDATFNTNGGTVFNNDATSNGFVVADSNMHDFNGYGYYGASPQFAAFIGNAFTNFTTNNHAIRVQGGTNGVGAYATNTYIAENTVTQNASISGGFGDVTERGDNTKSVIVNNSITSSSGTCMTIQPQNLQSVEHVINSLVEGNTIVSPLTPFSIAAQHVYVRNNVFIGADTAVTVLGDSQMPLNWTDKVFVLNNTHYLSNGTGGGDTYFLRHLTSSGTVTVANNLLWTSHASTTSSLVAADHSGTETNLGHNLVFAPNAGAQSSSNVGTGGLSTLDPKFVSNGADFHLQSTSPARNAGLSVAVYSDASGVTRPQEGALDIGAYEYKP